MICLDTNAVVAILNSKLSPVRARLADARRQGRPVSISAVVLFELRFGAAKSGNPERNARRIDEFLAGPVGVLPFDAEDAEEAGGIRAAIERAGNPIGPYDLHIAAQARRRGATLVTANLAEFARVPGLRIESWAAS